MMSVQASIATSFDRLQASWRGAWIVKFTLCFLPTMTLPGIDGLKSPVWAVASVFPVNPIGGIILSAVVASFALAAAMSFPKLGDRAIYLGIATLVVERILSSGPQSTEVSNLGWADFLDTAGSLVAFVVVVIYLIQRNRRVPGA